MSETRTVHDVAIVGAGPIGIELHALLRARGLDVLHLDAGPIGATLTWWAPQTKFFSSPERIAIAGVPLHLPDQEKATKEQYLTYLRTVVQQRDLPIETFRRVERVDRGDDGAFDLSIRGPHDTRAARARRVVLAIGDMHRPRMLDIPGEDLPHVSHYLKDPHLYFRRRVLIVGGKNSAVEAAIRLYRVGADVTISYRRTEFSERVKYWLRPELLFLIKRGSIGFLPSTAPVSISPEAVTLARTDDHGRPAGATLEVRPDFVLLMTGYEQDPTLFEQAGIELEGPNRAPRHNPRTMETNVPGIYVAGTAAAGTQVGGVKVFIETAHVHATRIAAHLTGAELGEEALEAPEYTLPES
jgi:thioredoxin reductase (NADPH)